MRKKNAFDLVNDIAEKIGDYFSPRESSQEERARRTMTGFLVIAIAPTLFSFSIFHLAQSDYLFATFYLSEQWGQPVAFSLLVLVLTKRLVEMHKGAIWTESEGMGKGR